jgi:hypothetical protein
MMRKGTFTGRNLVDMIKLLLMGPTDIIVAAGFFEIYFYLFLDRISLCSPGWP